MKRTFYPLRATAMTVCACLLAGCGGGNNGDGLTDTQREDRAASASSAGLLGFATTQVANATSDTAEPREVDGITPPADDTAEPLPI